MTDAQEKTVREPFLTLPPAEAELIRSLAAQDGNILEYGAGGSTVLFAAHPARSIFSVESDPAWIAMMQDWFAHAPPKARLTFHHADLGPTVEWGRPASHARLLSWPGYATDVWQRPDFVQPDVVLVDGRFRVSCLLATALFTRKPVRLLFDDYARRRYYHTVERFFEPVARHGRMAEFLIEPTTPPPATLAAWLPYFVDSR